MIRLRRARDHQYVSGVELSPELDRHLESNRKGIHVVGAAAGAPLLKVCINQGVEVIRSIARLMPPSGGDELLDLVVIGAGPAGVSAALEAKRRGYSLAVLEQGRVLNTITNYPDGKHVYAEPAPLKTLGELWFDDSDKEELLEKWGASARELEVECGRSVTDVQRRGDELEVNTKEGATYHCRRVIIALGRMGNPRKLGVPGEELTDVREALLNPGKYKDLEMVVCGGGNSAIEAAIALARRNHVTVIHRGDSFPRVFRSNQEQLEEGVQQGRIETLLKARVTAFQPGSIEVEVDGETSTRPRDLAFVLIGADPPVGFFKRLGIAMEGAWTGWRLINLAWVLALVYAIYGTKFGLWPFAGLNETLAAARVPADFLYGILYTILVTTFGLRALWKYKQDPLQRKRYSSLIAAQWSIYFLLPWLLFYGGYSDWWRTFGITLTYPLGYYGLWESGGSIFSGSLLPWTLGTLAAFLLVMPIASAYHGKRFCSWICPCGGLADTVGDAWRHKAPRGRKARRVEVSSTIVMVLTFLFSFYLILDYRLALEPDSARKVYKAAIDIGLACIVPITLYPFNGGRVWCRFFCPLAKWMELWGRWTGGKLAIVPNDECISCGECTRYCQMGIDVRGFAQREEPLSNESTCCVFCGICVTVCPVDVLKVERLEGGTRKWRADQEAAR